MNLEETATEIIADQLGVPVEEVTRDKKLDDDLGMDSLNRIDILMELEEEFDLSISDDTAEGWKTVGDAIGWLKGKVPTGSDK